MMRLANSEQDVDEPLYICGQEASRNAYWNVLGYTRAMTRELMKFLQ